MKRKKLTPRNAAPVKRPNVATVAHDRNAIRLIAPTVCMECGSVKEGGDYTAFAGDDAE